MFGAIGSFLGRVAIYVTAFLGLIALYFLWAAFREWRAGARAVFGVERDIARSEMIGSISRAGGFVLIGLLVFGLGWLGQQAESDGETAGATQLPAQTTPVMTTATPELAEPGPTLPPTDTPQPAVTGIPPLPEPTTEQSPVEPTPQTATVIAYGGVWLRDAPNGGTIVVVPQDSVVELLDGREFAGNYEWQKVRILSVPLGSDARENQEGWIAAHPDFLRVGP
jgi:hypothetical protein